MVLSFFSTKGGVGKSLLTNFFANQLKFSLIENGETKKVCVIDYDPQKTLSLKREKDIIILRSQGSKRYDFLKEEFLFFPYELLILTSYSDVLDVINSKEYDYIFIDFGGNFNVIKDPAFSLVDFFFVPVQVTQSDFLGFISFLKVAPKMNFKVIINKFTPTLINRVAKSESIMQEAKLPTCHFRFPQLISLDDELSTILPQGIRINLSTHELIPVANLTAITAEVVSIIRNFK